MIIEWNTHHIYLCIIVCLSLLSIGVLIIMLLQKSKKECLEKLNSISTSEVDILLANSLLSIIQLDKNHVIQRMNSAALRLCGWASEMIQGPSVSTVLDVRTQPDMTKVDLDQWLETVKETPHMDAFLFSRHWRAKDIHLKAVPTDSGFWLFIEDLSVRHKEQEELRQREKMETIGRLAGGVAHDFNNLLSVIMGHSDLLYKTMDEEDPKRRYVSQILDSTDKAASLINQLLTFSRKGPQSRSPIEFHNLIRDGVDLLESSLSKDIKIKMHLQALNHRILGDSAVLQNVILNLGLNAADAMPRGGTLSFHTEICHLDEEYCNKSKFSVKEGHYLHLLCQDTGHGMDDQTLENLFEPFFTTKEVGKGTGLGLSAVYGAVQSHRGAIDVFSSPGNGSAFHLYFPLL